MQLVKQWSFGIHWSSAKEAEARTVFSPGSFHAFLAPDPTSLSVLCSDWDSNTAMNELNRTSSFFLFDVTLRFSNQTTVFAQWRQTSHIQQHDVAHVVLGVKITPGGGKISPHWKYFPLSWIHVKSMKNEALDFDHSAHGSKQRKKPTSLSGKFRLGIKRDSLHH